MTALVGGLLLVEVALALVAGYVTLLTAAALLHRGAPRPASPPRSRFAVLIPAHDEELLIGRLLDSLRAVEYPEWLFDLFVVADNCADATARIARDRGATVFEQTERAIAGKGHALHWLIERLPIRAYDAFVILDADSVVSPNFLRAMNDRLLAGSRVIQAYYAVANPAASWAAGLRSVALALVHYLRPLGKSVLGLSAGLKGNGMCLARAVIEQHGWSTFSLAEDVEYHLRLIRSGVKVDFAPEAVVRAEMPARLRNARSQNLRWERGRWNLARREGLPLLLAGLKKGCFMELDAAWEQLTPPFSVPVLLALACLLAGILIGSPVAALGAAAILVCHLVYLIAGLALSRPPLSVCASLAFAPAYVVWKGVVYATALAAAGAGPWVRTERE